MVTAGGILHKAKLPRIDGIEDFVGKEVPRRPMGLRLHRRQLHHPARQVGRQARGCHRHRRHCGASRTAARGRGQELFIFQRTPSAVGIRNNRVTDPGVVRGNGQQAGLAMERIVNFTDTVTGNMPEVDLVQDGWTHVMRVNTSAAAPGTPEALELEIDDLRLMDSLRERVDVVVNDPATAEKLKPWYGKTCKRICFHDDYLPAFNRPNVHLIDTDGRGVDGITRDWRDRRRRGVPRRLHRVRVRASISAPRSTRRCISIRSAVVGSRCRSIGRGGTHAARHLLGGVPQLDADQPRAGAFGTNGTSTSSPTPAPTSRGLIAQCLERGIATIEPTPEAEEEWLMKLYGTVPAGGQDYTARCTPGYQNGEQAEAPASAACNLLWIGSCVGYGQQLEQWRAAGDMPGVTLVKAAQA